MKLQQVTSFVPCSDMARQNSYFCDRLGFSAGYPDDVYAYLDCDSAALRLVPVDADPDLSHPGRQNSFNIDVQDIDTLWRDLKPPLEGLPHERVNQSHGQREFHVADENCTLIFFGEAPSTA